MNTRSIYGWMDFLDTRHVFVYMDVYKTYEHTRYNMYLIHIDTVYVWVDGYNKYGQRNGSVNTIQYIQMYKVCMQHVWMHGWMYGWTSRKTDFLHTFSYCIIIIIIPFLSLLI